MARPRKEKKDARITFTLTPELEAQLREKARTEGETLSGLISAYVADGLHETSSAVDNEEEKVFSEVISHISKQNEHIIKLVETMISRVDMVENLINQSPHLKLISSSSVESQEGIEEGEILSTHVPIEELQALSKAFLDYKQQSGKTNNTLRQEFGCDISPMSRWSEGRLNKEEKVTWERYEKFKSKLEELGYM